ncbi:hypothetical protein [Spiroplasma endosymbiont of Dioctria linearis]|uniref:hypothetical protein n=1 Tax=Spiroplasma endosymbiont of Dioctria linearis TaxID=3066290 RepID=UPI00313AB9ED
MAISNHKRNTLLDLIKREYRSDKYLKKIEIEGTWFKNIYINGAKNKHLFSPVYDFYSNEISSYSVGNSENITVTLEMLESLIRKTGLGWIKKIFIHSDLSSALISKETEKFCNQNNILRSNLVSRFKGIKFLEQIHRWLKQYFN